MRQFELHVDDDRSARLRLDLVVISDILRATQLADQLLQSCGHHRGVQVCEGGRRIFGLGSCATRQAGARAHGKLRRSVARVADGQTQRLASSVRASRGKGVRADHVARIV